MPEDAPLLDFSIENGLVHFDGIWLRSSRLSQLENENYHLCVKCSDFLGIRNIFKDKSATNFLDAIKSFYNELATPEETGICRPIHEFAQFLKNNPGRFDGN